jgi:hypothetical protein
MSIEFRYRNINPYFVDFLHDVVWNRMLSHGMQNMRFNSPVVIKEDSPTFPLHAFSFMKVTNRERKLIIAADIGGENHSIDADITSLDGLNIKNQQGASNETFSDPPFAIVPIWPCIELWKKITSAAGSLDFLYSVVEHPEANRDDIRNMRSFHDEFRVSNTSNPVSAKSLRYGINFSKFDRTLNRSIRLLNAPTILPPTNINPLFLNLYMAPDMDYPQENEMIVENNDFNSVTNRVINDGDVDEPDGFFLSGPLQSADDVLAKVPQVIDSLVLTLPDLRVLKIPTIESSDTQPLDTTDPNWALWNNQGISFRVEGTPPYLRDNPTRYRHDFNRDGLANVVYVSTTNVAALSFSPEDDYFQDTEYSQKSEPSNYERWESDNGTGGSVFTIFDSGGLTPFVSGAVIRHTFNQTLDRIVPARYDMRYNQGTYNSTFGHFLWDNWADGNDTLIDYFAETTDISPTISMRTSLDNPTFTEYEKFVIELGRKGGREKAYKLKFRKTGTHDIDITVGNSIDRKIYKGDLLKYEILIDSLSLDGFCYLDIEYYDAGTSGSTSLLQDFPNNVVTEVQIERVNEWFKVTIPLDLIEGKYIKHIHFRSESNQSALGISTMYFNEVQIINVLDMFNGRQFVSCFNYRRVGLGPNIIDPPLPSIHQWRPFVSLITIFADPITGDPVNFYSSGTIINESVEPFDSVTVVSPILGTDERFKWWTSQHTIRFSSLLKEVIFFIGIPKTLVSGGNTHGPQPGNSFEIERMFLYPMCDLSFVASYSTETDSPNNNPMTLVALDAEYDNFIPYNPLGYKAWAVESSGRFVHIDETGGK